MHRIYGHKIKSTVSYVFKQEEKIMDIKWNKAYIIHWTRKSNCQWSKNNMKIIGLKPVIKRRICVDKRISGIGGGIRV
jgi:hypothetical protein